MFFCSSCNSNKKKMGHFPMEFVRKYLEILLESCDDMLYCHHPLKCVIFPLYILAFMLKVTGLFIPADSQIYLRCSLQIN